MRKCIIDLIVVLILASFSTVKMNSVDQVDEMKTSINIFIDDSSKNIKKIENLVAGIEDDFKKLQTKLKKCKQNLPLECPADYKLYRNRYCFHWKFNTKTNYIDDFKYCQSKSSGFLIEKHYKIAAQELQKAFPKNRNRVYVGLHDVNNEMTRDYSDWRWASTGKTFKENKPNLWYAHPDNWQNKEHFALFYYDTKKIGDIALLNAYKHDVICEWNAERAKSATSALSDWQPTRFGENPQTGFIGGRTPLNKIESQESLENCFKSCTKTGKYCISFYYSEVRAECVVNFYIDTLLPAEIEDEADWVKYMRS